MSEREMIAGSVHSAERRGPAQAPQEKAGPQQERTEGASDRARPVALAVLHVDLDDDQGGGPSGVLAQVPAGGPSVLSRMVVALGQVAWVRDVALVVTGDPGADPEGALGAEADRLKLQWVRGAGEDALAGLADGLRVLGVGEDQPLVLLPGASPLLCPEVVGAAVEGLVSAGGRHEVVATDLGSGVLPGGMDVIACCGQVIYALDAALAPGPGPGDARRRDPAALVRRSPLRHRAHELSPPELGPALERSGRYYASFHLGLRTEEDVARLQTLVGVIDRQQEPRALSTLLRLLDQHPEWRPARQAMLAR